MFKSKSNQNFCNTYQPSWDKIYSMGSSRQYFGNNAHWIPMPLHDLIISIVKEIIMNNYSFFQVVGGDGGSLIWLSYIYYFKILP